MSLQRFGSSVVLAATLALPAHAFAQSTAGVTAPALGTGGIIVRVASVNGEANREANNVYLGIEACRNDWQVEFSLDSLPPNKSSIDIYRGDNCNTSSRTSTTGEGCVFLDNVTIRQQLQMPVPLAASKLFTNGCESKTQNTPNLWFLPVNDSQTTEQVSIYGRTNIIIADADPPYPPTGVHAGSGERTIGVSWTSDDQARNLDRFLIYVDPDPGAVGSPAAPSDADGGTTTATGTTNSMCPSSVLFAGQAPPATPPNGILVETVSNESQSKYSIDPIKLGLGEDPAAISIVAVDRANNYSAFSEVVCASAVPTQDFWESYQSNGG